MKFNIGDHLQEIGSKNHGIVTNQGHYTIGKSTRSTNCYLINNDELGLVNHWVAESDLELHKQPLREQKLKELGI